MTCREIAEFLMDYLNGELTEATRATFEAHVGGCTACRNYLDGYRKTVAVTKAALGEPQVDVAEIPEPLVQAILAAQRSGTDATSS